MSGLPADIEKGLAHVGPMAATGSNTERGVAQAIALLDASRGNPWACIAEVARYLSCKALVAWYRDHDLTAFRQHAYGAAKAEWMCFQYDELYPAFTPLWFLLSNHPRLIARFVDFSPPNYLEREGKTIKHIEYWFLTTALCMKGDWPRVAERCRYILANPPRKAWLKYQIDYEIMLALAERNKAAMETALAVLCSKPYQRKRNHELPFGLTEHFIGTQAVVYTKLAWYHGLEIEVDSPSVPREWLPMTPAPSYPEPYEYFAKFDIEAPLEWKGG